jgi:hypothetical protein
MSGLFQGIWPQNLQKSWQNNLHSTWDPKQGHRNTRCQLPVQFLERIWRFSISCVSISSPRSILTAFLTLPPPTHIHHQRDTCCFHTPFRGLSKHPDAEPRSLCQPGSILCITTWQQWHFSTSASVTHVTSCRKPMRSEHFKLPLNITYRSMGTSDRLSAFE